MDNNRSQWDQWRKAEDARSRRKTTQELRSEGYDYYKQLDFSRAIDCFRAQAELAEEQGDVNSQCEGLYWEGHCWWWRGKLKTALERLLRADELGGGDSGLRFGILEELFSTINTLPLPRDNQEAMLKKLAPFKGTACIGGSKSSVLNLEMQLQRDIGNLPRALELAQEAFASRVDRYPSSNDGIYYRELIRSYRENGMLTEARKTLRDWRANGSTTFANTKSTQFRAEAQILYAEGRLAGAWDAIRRCQAEEQYLNIYGTTGGTATLTWLIRIGADSGRLKEARAALPLLYNYYSSESKYFQYNCCYWFAYYYAALAQHLREGNSGGAKYRKGNISRKCAKAWYRRAERIGHELDELLKTDVKRKELEDLNNKLQQIP